MIAKQIWVPVVAVVVVFLIVKIGKRLLGLRGSANDISLAERGEEKTLHPSDNHENVGDKIKNVLTEEEKTPSGLPWPKRAKKFWEENELVILLAWGIFHIDFWLAFPNWWVRQFGTLWMEDGTFTGHSLRVWGAQLVLIAFALMIPTGDTKFIHKLGQIGVRVATGALLFILFWPTTWINNLTTQAMASTRNTPYPAPAANTRDFLNENPEGRKVLEEELERQKIPEVQRPFLIGLGGCESTFQPFEDDNKTPYRHREEDPNNPGVLRKSERPIDGVFQINMEESAQGKNVRALGLDMTTLERQVKAATWILNHEGGRKWSCYNDVKAKGIKEVRIIEAPVGENNWSKEIEMGNDSTFDSKGLVRVKLSSGRIITHFEHETTPFPERTATINVQTVGEVPVNVIITQ